MKIPEESSPKNGLAGQAVSRAGGAFLCAARMVWRAIALATRGVGKFIATVWRLAGALDAALWRGVRLMAATAWRAARVVARIGVSAAGDLIRWLPTRAGRAYSAFSGIVLIIASLWIVDELRVAPADDRAPGADRRPPVDLDDPILARIDGRYVHLSEVESAARASGALRDNERLTPQAAFSRRLVETYIEQRLLARAALDEGVHRHPQTARQLAAARERILAAAYMQSRLDSAATEAAVEKYYAEQSDVTRLGDEVRARQILVDTGEEAASVIAALNAGGDFGTLARQLSKDRSTAALGGDLGWFTRDMMAPVLAGAAFTTPVGAVAPPFQSEFGWHVIEVMDRRKTSGVPLESVKDNIRRFLTLRAIERTLVQLKEESDVVYYNSGQDPAASTRNLPPPAGGLREAAPLPSGPG